MSNPYVYADFSTLKCTEARYKQLQLLQKPFEVCEEPAEEKVYAPTAWYRTAWMELFPRYFLPEHGEPEKALVHIHRALKKAGCPFPNFFAWVMCASVREFRESDEPKVYFLLEDGEAKSYELWEALWEELPTFTAELPVMLETAPTLLSFTAEVANGVAELDPDLSHIIDYCDIYTFVDGWVALAKDLVSPEHPKAWVVCSGHDGRWNSSVVHETLGGYAYAIWHTSRGPRAESVDLRRWLARKGVR